MAEYVEGHGVKDSAVLHWVRAADAEVAHIVPPRGICGRLVNLGEPAAPSRPCMNCARRKAAYQHRSEHRLTVRHT